MSKRKKQKKAGTSGKKVVRKGAGAGGGKKALRSVVAYWDQKSPVLKFLLGFGLSMVVFYLLYLSPFFVEHVVRPILGVEAGISSFLLNLLGQDTTANADVIAGPDYSISIKNGCDGLETLAIMLSGILVFPISFRLKWPGLLYGTLALMVLNLFRIVGLYLAGRYWSKEVFDLLHEQGGFVIFTVLGIFLWIIWANWALHKQREGTQGPANPTGL